ncbi:hypothetical protein ES705_44821 [subsurface metagenome]
MRIMNVKRTIFFLLVIGIMAIVAGCARWPHGPEPGPGTDYQLEITVEVKGEIDTDNGIYYIGLDTDGQTGFGPGDDINDWKGVFYYIKLDFGGCYLYSKDEESEIELNPSYYGSNKLKITVSLSDLGDPESSIDINAVTTDSDGYTTYDYLDDYFNIGTVLYSTGVGFSSNDLEDDEGDFDIIEVLAEITNI